MNFFIFVEKDRTGIGEGGRGRRRRGIKRKR
jgi:hypothetical protein